MFFTKVARTPGQRFRTFSCQAGLWLRVDSWLNAVAKTGVKVGHATCKEVALQLEFGDSEPDMASTLREELVGCLTSGETLSRNREEVCVDLPNKPSKSTSRKIPKTTNPGSKEPWSKG